MNDCVELPGIDGSFTQFSAFGRANIYRAPNSSYNLNRGFLCPSPIWFDVWLSETDICHDKIQRNARQNEDTEGQRNSLLSHARYRVDWF